MTKTKDPIKTANTFLKPMQIRGAIMLVAGEMPNDFAKKRGITRSTLHRVINNEMQTEHVRKAISKAIGFSIKELWPEEKAA